MDASLPQRLLSLERRIRELEEGAEPAERQRLCELLQTVLEWHGSALARLLELIARAGEPGQQILHLAGEDELIRSLLLLHGMHGQDVESRVVGALKQVRPFLHSQGADVELTAIADDAVRLHLWQTEGKYPATMQTLRAAVEEAICTAAPDVEQIEFVEATPSRHPLPVLKE